MAHQIDPRPNPLSVPFLQSRVRHYVDGVGLRSGLVHQFRVDLPFSVERSHRVYVAIVSDNGNPLSKSRLTTELADDSEPPSRPFPERVRRTT